MRLVRVEDAVGKRLAYDCSGVSPSFKSALKRRGETITPEDVELLKNNGHYFVYIDEGDVEYGLHEDEAVVRFSEIIAGENVLIEKAPEGKAFLRAGVDGLLFFDPGELAKVNSTGVFLVIARKSGSYVKRGDIIGVVDLIPLSIPHEYLSYVSENLLQGRKLIKVYENKHPKVGIVVAGTEIVEGRKRDMASPVVIEKLRYYEIQQGALVYSRDDEYEIAGKIEEILVDHDAVIVTGGMSVDPTDKTPKAISMVADEVVAYGIPVKPTTMNMIAYRGGKAIIGVSSGIIYFQDYNILDIVLPWIAAQVKIPRDFIVSLGNGGLSDYFLEKIKK